MSRSDVIITEGFPEGWFIQDRVAENEALLCRKSDFAYGGCVCICVRPRATQTKDWIRIAHVIAAGFDVENEKRLSSDTPA